MQKFYTTLETKASKEDDRTVEFIASKEVVDRDGEILKVKGIDLKDYKKNPVVLWAHDRGGLPIGKATKLVKSGGELKIKVKFAEPEVHSFADTVYKLIKGGFLSAVSIGFMPDFESIEYPKNRKGVYRIFHKSSLLELSVVPVPANQDALSTGKALKEGVIDEVELKEFEMYCKTAEKDFDDYVDEAKKHLEENSDNELDSENELKEIRLELEEYKTEVGYLKSLFEEFGKDTSAASAADEGQTDEFTEEDMEEIMNELGFDPDEYEEN